MRFGSIAPPSQSSLIYDHGASDNCIRRSDSVALPLTEVSYATHPRTLRFPNGATIASIGSANLPVGPLSLPADIYADADLERSLFSPGQATARGCESHETNTTATLTLHGETILTADKAPGSRHWLVDTARFPTNRQNPAASNMATVKPSQSIADRVLWCHASLGSPTPSLLQQAFDRGYVTFPGVTAADIRRHPPRTTATNKGHMSAQRKGYRSTDPFRADAPARPGPAAVAPLPEPAVVATVETSTDDFLLHWDQRAYSYIVARETTIHGDATGPFPVPSVGGYNYVLVMSYNNYQHLIPLKDRSGAEYARAYASGIEFFKRLGHSPSWIRIDNETSAHLEKVFTDAKLTVQHVPVNLHRANKAERGIQSAKNHIIASLAAADPSFPLAHWHDVIPTMELTLSLLLPWTANNALCAYEGLFGYKYDVIAHPLGPVGCRVDAYVPMGNRTLQPQPASSLPSPKQPKTSWGMHCVSGWYIGPRLSQYRQHVVLVGSTTRQVSQLDWQPHALLVAPRASPVEDLTAAVRDMTASARALRSTSHYVPVRAALHELWNIFDPDFTPPVSAVQPGIALPPPSVAPPLPSVAPFLPALETAPSPPAPTHPAPATRVVSPVPPVPSTRTAPSPKVASPVPVPPAPGFRAAPSPRVVVPVPPAPAPATAPSDESGHRRSGRTRRPSRRIATAAHTTPTPPAILTVDPKPSADRASNEWQVWLANVYDRSASAYSATVLNLDAPGKPLTLRSAVAGPHSSIWSANSGTEICKLLDTGTFRPQYLTDLPRNVKAHSTYYNPQVREKPKPGEPPDGIQRRVRGAVGGDRLTPTGPTTANVAEIDVIKGLLNAVVSEQNCLFFTADITDFYLGTDLYDPVWVPVPLRFIPASVLDARDLRKYAAGDKIWFKVEKTIYGLKNAGILSKQKLDAHLALHGYLESSLVPCLYRHDSNGTIFTLVVDDFAIKCSTAAAKEHLQATLTAGGYGMKYDDTGSKYVGLTIDLDRAARTITLSMPGYVDKMFARLPHRLIKECDSPMIYTPPSYGTKGPQQAPAIDTAPPLSLSEVTEVQSIIGAGLYYSRMVDLPTLPAVCDLSSAQAGATQSILPKIDRYLGYLKRNPDTKIVIHASDMQYKAYTDASHLSVPGARSRAGVYGFFGWYTQKTRLNGATCALSKVIPVVTTSAAESEYAGLFLGGQQAAWMRLIASELGYPQGATPLLCDNSTAVGISTRTTKTSKMKSIDMRFHWIRDRVGQGQFTVQWIPGGSNVADFFTKALPVHEHVRLANLLSVGRVHNARRQARSAAYTASQRGRTHSAR